MSTQRMKHSEDPYLINKVSSPLKRMCEHLETTVDYDHQGVRHWFGEHLTPSISFMSHTPLF
jgi:hypothetical protein